LLAPLLLAGTGRPFGITTACNAEPPASCFAAATVTFFGVISRPFGSPI
jgi:hypothetical protein